MALVIIITALPVSLKMDGRNPAHSSWIHHRGHAHPAYLHFGDQPWRYRLIKNAM